MLFSGNLRRDYELLHMLEEEHKKLGRSKQEICDRRVIKQLKEGIRNTYRDWVSNKDEEVIWHYDIEGDGRWCKFIYESLPEEWQDDMTREEAIKEYKEDEWWHWYNPWDDGRDCTGVWFTNYICVFPIPELHRTIVYHSQSCDV